MASWLREATAAVATATLATTPVHSNGLLLVFPVEIWELIIPNVLEEALGRLAASARFLRKLIDDERHWRRRLALHGLLELFESHQCHSIFTNWKEYFAAHYLASRKPYFTAPLPFVSEYEASLDAAPRVQFDDELQDQFSSVQPHQVKEILFMQASKPYYARYNGVSQWYESRGAHKGQEHGVFLLKSGELHARNALRSDNEHANKFFEANVASFRELKSAYALHSVACPFPFSYLDWHSHLLDCIRRAADGNLAYWQTREAEEHYFTVISRRWQPPRITVHYQLVSAKFEVRQRSASALLGKIVKHFGIGEELHSVSYKQVFLQNDPRVVFPRETTFSLTDGQVWLLRPDKVSKRNSMGLQMP